MTQLEKSIHKVIILLKISHHNFPTTKYIYLVYYICFLVWIFYDLLVD